MRSVKSRTRRKVLVTLKTGSSFGGVLWSADRSCLVLRQASHLEADKPPTPVDGEVVVLLADVEFLQFP